MGNTYLPPALLDDVFLDAHDLIYEEAEQESLLAGEKQNPLPLLVATFLSFMKTASTNKLCLLKNRCISSPHLPAPFHSLIPLDNSSQRLFEETCRLQEPLLACSARQNRKEVAYSRFFIGSDRLCHKDTWSAVANGSLDELYEFMLALKAADGPVPCVMLVTSENVDEICVAYRASNRAYLEGLSDEQKFYCEGLQIGEQGSSVVLIYAPILLCQDELQILIRSHQASAHYFSNRKYATPTQKASLKSLVFAQSFTNPALRILTDAVESSSALCDLLDLDDIESISLESADTEHGSSFTAQTSALWADPQKFTSMSRAAFVSKYLLRNMLSLCSSGGRVFLVTIHMRTGKAVVLELRPMDFAAGEEALRSSVEVEGISSPCSRFSSGVLSALMASPLARTITMTMRILATHLNLFGFQVKLSGVDAAGTDLMVRWIVTAVFGHQDTNWMHAFLTSLKTPAAIMASVKYQQHTKELGILPYTGKGQNGGAQTKARERAEDVAAHYITSDPILVSIATDPQLALGWLSKGFSQQFQQLLKRQQGLSSAVAEKVVFKLKSLAQSETASAKSTAEAAAKVSTDITALHAAQDETTTSRKRRKLGGI